MLKIQWNIITSSTSICRFLESLRTLKTTVLLEALGQCRNYYRYNHLVLSYIEIQHGVSHSIRNFRSKIIRDLNRKILWRLNYLSSYINYHYRCLIFCIRRGRTGKQEDLTTVDMRLNVFRFADDIVLMINILMKRLYCYSNQNKEQKK